MFAVVFHVQVLFGVNSNRLAACCNASHRAIDKHYKRQTVAGTNQKQLLYILAHTHTQTVKRSRSKLQNRPTDQYGLFRFASFAYSSIIFITQMLYSFCVEI